VAAQVAAGEREIQHEEQDGHRDRRDDGGVPLGVAGVAEDDRHERDEHGGSAEPEMREQRPAVELRLVRPDDLGDAEDEQDVRDHAAGERSADDLGQPVVDCEQCDDQLGRVAEACVEEAPDSGARVLCRILRRLADQPRERDERGAGEHEHHRVAHVREVAQRDRRGREGKQRPEDAACHGAASLDD